MRGLAVGTAVAVSLVLAASALAVLPSKRSKFNGVTSEHAINGYHPTVTFTAPAGGRTLTNFVFETLGCFGSGQFAVGVDPFIENPWRVTRIPVSAKGAYSAKVRPVGSSPDAGTMTATITGTFTSQTAAVGKITFSQVQDQADCGPRTLKFTVKTGRSASSSP
jgi:hypothetical protein